MASIVLLVSIFIATVTFSAGFTVAGGDNNSNNANDPHQGIATMVMNHMFHAFVISNNMPLYTSILVAVTLIWAQSGDIYLVPSALKLALPLLGVSLVAMSIAFMTGLHLVVSSLAWLGNAVFFMGLIFFVTLSALCFVLCLGSSNCRLSRYISYYLFRFVVFASGSYEDEEERD